MRRIITLVVAVSLLAITAPDATASGRGPCDADRYDTRPRMGKDRIHRKVRALIRCAEDRWSVPGGVAKALDVADCESSFWPWARGGDNLGVYQHKDDYWVSRVRRYLRERWFSEHRWRRLRRLPQGAFHARANVIVAMRMAHGSGWGPWACA